MSSAFAAPWFGLFLSVFRECQEGRDPRKSEPSPHPTLFSCCSLPVDEVSVLWVSGHAPSGEHCRYRKPDIDSHHGLSP